MDTVTSADGTIIAYDHVGDGPPLIVSVGAFCTRQTFIPPADLSRHFTVYTYDRRGRGDSGDTQPYAPEREYEDLAAVAAAATAGTGTSAGTAATAGTGATAGRGISAGGERPFVFGHSSGAAIALRAAARGLPVAGIVAYEAPFGNDDTPPPGVQDPATHIRSLVAEDRRDEAVAFWMSDVVHLPAEVLAGMRNMPWLKALEPLTPTLPYDILVTDGGVPAAELAAITVPVLVLGGTNSPAWFQRSVADQAAAIPGGRLQMIDGYDHNAPPEVIAPILFGFFC
jgi:pimeloyl-ACP methyl ester carboxylesterase